MNDRLAFLNLDFRKKGSRVRTFAVTVRPFFIEMHGISVTFGPRVCSRSETPLFFTSVLLSDMSANPTEHSLFAETVFHIL